jgi:hypothetical protein
MQAVNKQVFCVCLLWEMRNNMQPAPVITCSEHITHSRVAAEESAHNVKRSDTIKVLLLVI